MNYRRVPSVYAVILDSTRQKVLTVQTKRGYFLPGGGMKAQETRKDSFHREILEELGYEVRVIRFIGEAERYYYAAKQDEYLINEGYFYLAELGKWKQKPVEMDHWSCWLLIQEAFRKLIHEHHAWAVKQVCTESQ